MSHRHLITHRPQSNGFIERMVQTVKQTLTKAKETGSDPHMAMLCLRTTPIDHNTAAPCELLNGRRYQSNVPAMSSLNTGTGYKATLQQSQDKCKTYYDAHSKALPPLHVQEDVRVFDQHTKTWNPGKVVGIAPTPRSYHVSTTNGVYRRNRRHIRKTLEQFEPDSTITNPQVDNDLPDQEPVKVTVTNAPDVLDSPRPIPRRSSRPSVPPDRLTYP